MKSKAQPQQFNLKAGYSISVPNDWALAYVRGLKMGVYKTMTAFAPRRLMTAGASNAPELLSYLWAEDLP
jgi:hypothetical protein